MVAEAAAAERPPAAADGARRSAPARPVRRFDCEGRLVLAAAQLAARLAPCRDGLAAV